MPPPKEAPVRQTLMTAISPDVRNVAPANSKAGYAHTIRCFLPSESEADYLLAGFLQAFGI